MPYFVRPMHQEDIPQVREIDREAFPTALPPLNFERELRNPMMRYYVVCDEEKLVEPPGIPRPPVRNSGLIKRLRKWLYPGNIPDNSLPPKPVRQAFICGYVGFWVMADEAHITTIAVREELQRRGIGELLLMAVLNGARKLFASVLTLEVRVSNTGAQKLYLKYGFRQAGIRKAYYTDNREDAYIMTTGDVTADEYRKQERKLAGVHASRWGEARFYCCEK